jgi:hypothetical protein
VIAIVVARLVIVPSQNDSRHKRNHKLPKSGIQTQETAMNTRLSCKMSTCSDQVTATNQWLPNTSRETSDNVIRVNVVSGSLRQS